MIPFPVLPWTYFRYSPGSYLFRYSHEFYLPGTRQDQFSGTRSDLTFTVLPRIRPFWYSPESYLPGTLPDPSPVLTRMQSLFRYLPKYYLFRYSPRCNNFSDTFPDTTFFGTCSDPTFQVLARIDPLCFLFSGTCSDSILFVSSSPVLARIRSFLYLVFRYLPESIPFCFSGSPASHSNPLVLMFQISGIVSGFSYTTSSIVLGL